MPKSKMMENYDLEKLNSKDPKVKYGFAKELLRMGAAAGSIRTNART